MQGLLGDEEGEREYQKRVADAKKSSSKYVQAQHAVLAHGGTIKWNASAKKATITINGITKDYYPGDGLGTFMNTTRL